MENIPIPDDFMPAYRAVMPHSELLALYKRSNHPENIARLAREDKPRKRRATPAQAKRLRASKAAQATEQPAMPVQAAQIISPEEAAAMGITVPDDYREIAPLGTTEDDMMGEFLMSGHPDNPNLPAIEAVSRRQREERRQRKLASDSTSSTITPAQAETVPHAKPMYMPNRSIVSNIPGDNVEGLRQICEAWNIRWRFNVRTDAPEYAEANANWREMKKPDRQTFKEHILTRATMDNNKPVKFRTIGNLDDPIVALAKEHSIDPIWHAIDHNIGEWDGQPRLEWQLQKHFKTPDGLLERWASAYPFLAVIQRAVYPGCDLQQFPVLVGPQNVGKSHYLQRLIPVGEQPMHWVNPKFSFTTRPRANYYATKKSAIVEWSEMEGILKSNNEALKAWLTAAFDIEDPKWEDTAGYPRRFIIIGTCNPNNAKLPNDPDGNRRYVMIECPERIEKTFDALDAEKNQIWAEAKHRFFKDGMRANLPKDLWLAQEVRNAKYRNDDDLESLIASAIDQGLVWEGITANEIAKEMHMIHADGLVADKGDQMRISEAMHNLKWYSTRKQVNGVQATRYYRGAK